MKKLAFLPIFALIAGLTACDDFDYPNPPGQSNPQEPVFEQGNLVMTPDASASTVDLIAVNDADKLVNFAEVNSIENLPEGYDLYFVGEMAPTESFENAADFATTLVDSKVMADPDDLNAAFRLAMGTIDPKPQTTYIRFKAYAKKDANILRLGGSKVYYSPLTSTIRPFNPGFTVEEKYYLVGTCTDGTIDRDKAIELHNSGVSPYDDPVFSTVVEVNPQQAADGYQWAVVPESTMAAGSGIVLGPSDEEMTDLAAGYLKTYNSLGVYAVINSASAYKIVVNLRPDEQDLYSYSTSLALPNLWAIGQGCGWNFDNAQALYTNDYTTYFGYAYLDSEAKFSKSNDWSHGDFGGTPVTEDKGILVGELTDGGSNISGIPASLYWCSANIGDMKYALTPITSMAIIGDATPGGWSDETKMTPSDNGLTWTLTTTLTAGKEMKFRANNGWDINLGGEDLQILTQSGPNYKVPDYEGGEVTITLSLGKLPYSATITK